MKNIPIIFLALLITNTFSAQAVKNGNTRDYFINSMLKISNPVLVNLSNNELKINMPVEVSFKQVVDRTQFTYLEAFGRTISGIAPWLELGPDATKEGKLREEYIQLTLKCLKNSADPNAADYMNFSNGAQPLVDAAFLAQGLLRAPKQLWGRLDKITQQNIIKEFKETRKLTPGYNNWLLFTATIEAALLQFDGEADMVRIMFALNKHEEWYLGDGIYGDGPDFHWDYYNSFVIHPMLIDIYTVLKDKSETLKEWRFSKDIERYNTIVDRAKQYARIQEKLISPEGTYPPIGRSLTYRFGAFQLLSQMALLNRLPEDLAPSQVRGALEAIIKKQMTAQDMFDKKGWLTIGLYGYQPEMAEKYISTGSLYICSEVFLALGLPPENAFWSDGDVDWSQKKIWSNTQ